MRPTTLTLLIVLISNCLYSQIRVYKKNYDKTIKVGVYKKKSLSDYKNIEKIERQTKYKKTKTSGLIYVDKKPIYLFDRINDNGKSKPVGVLTQTSFIDIDTIYFNEIYKRPTEKWFVTFNVWYAIKINGKKYYTDYQTHNVAFEKEIKNNNQKFLLSSQSTGYDFYMDLGYPEHFFAIFLDHKNNMIFESKEFDFVCGDEFWQEDYGSIKVVENKTVFTFTLFGYKNKIVGQWNGKTLTHKKYGS